MRTEQDLFPYRARRARGKLETARTGRSFTFQLATDLARALSRIITIDNQYNDRGSILEAKLRVER